MRYINALSLITLYNIIYIFFLPPYYPGEEEEEHIVSAKWVDSIFKSQKSTDAERRKKKSQANFRTREKKLEISRDQMSNLL